MIRSDLLFHNTTIAAAASATAAVTTAATTILSPLIATTTASLINGYMNSNFAGLNLNNITNNLIQLNNDSQTIINNNHSVAIVGGGGGNGVGYNEGIIDDNKDLYEYYSQISLCEVKNIFFNCTVQEYLKYVRGPQTLPLSTALSVTIFFLGIFITGILGNVLVCVVIIRNSGMHTATNYYLFSLAVSDLIFLLWGLPYEISLYWHQYPYNLGLGFCKFRALISEASTYVSVLTIVAFSMERFLAICHPLHLYTMSGFKRAVRIIAVLWVVSFLSAVPFGVYTKIDYIIYPLDNSTIQDSAFCAMLENPNGFPLWELSSLVFFAIPMVIIIILYGRMGLRIRNRTQHSAALGVQHGSMHGESRQSKSRRAIIRMLAAVVITFFVCWAPFHAQRLMFLYAHNWEHYQDLNDWLFSVTGWLYYVSCTINPILYNIMSQRYRVAFRETLCGTKRGYYRNNGFCREQSSFRETTITVSSSNAGYETSHLIRARSMPTSKYSKYCTERIANIKETDESLTDNCNDTVKWNNDENSTVVTKLPDENSTNIGGNQPTIPTSDVIVVIGNTANGRPKCYASSGGGGGGIGGASGDNGIRGNLLNSDSNDNDSFSKKDETCI